MGRDEYIARLTRSRERTFRWHRALAIVSILAFAAMLVIERVVAWELIGLPTKATTYIHDTPFYQFSFSELRRLIDESGHSLASPLPLAISVYIAFHVFGLIAVTFVIFLSSRRGLFIIGDLLLPGHWPRFAGDVPYVRGLLAAYELRRSIEQYLIDPDRRTKRCLRSVARRARFAALVSPFRPHWQEYSTTQWVRLSSFPGYVRRIVAAISAFDRAVVFAVAELPSEDHVRILREPLCTLDFFFAVALRRDATLRSLNESQPRLDLADEEALLQRFANLARPVTISVLCARNRLVPQRSRFVLAAQRIYGSPIVRTAVSLSGVAAAVMMIGVLIFRIDAEQAFLTWFTVSFGSLTVSLGVMYFRIVSEEGKERKNAESSNQAMETDAKERRGSLPG